MGLAFMDGMKDASARCYYTYPGLEYDGLNVCLVMNVDIRSYYL